jgi:DMSO/TMAO reductase YedYZ molybdopterin-dependent catalytic subunit
VLAEGADGAALSRTIPIAMAQDDVLVCYGQNGEMLRPEQGFPLRLLVPGVQGVSSVKRLRRLEVGDQPWNTREESLHYIDLMPGGMHRQTTWIQEAKSVITTPSGSQVTLDRGYHEITVLAWSGRGEVARHRRHGLRAIDDSATARCTGHALDPSKQRDPDLARRLFRKCEQCPGGAISCAWDARR